MTLTYLEEVGLPVGGAAACKAEVRATTADAAEAAAPAEVPEGAGGDGDRLVQPTRFVAIAAEEQPKVKEAVLEVLRAHSEWHGLVCDLVAKHKIKVTCTASAGTDLVATHLTLHNDNVLIKLGRAHNFPRGFCLVVDTAARRLAGQGTFYPKFANDDRNASFSAKDFGGVTAISCFLKYSGSAGIITIIRDIEGRAVAWTGSSKNSCNHGPPADGGPSYPSEVAEIFGRYATERFLRWCDTWRVSSLGLEVFIATDQSHGYGYAASGCIVTAVCVDGDTDGRAIYLHPKQLYAACQEIGLPTDRPMCVEGQGPIQSFVESLSTMRDLLTLSSLRRVLLDECGVELETMHGSLIDSEIIEGFVIRRWRGDVEVDAVKFKIWLYQMVTQVLRPSLRGSRNALDFRGQMASLKAPSGDLQEAFTKLMEKEVAHWCVSDDPTGLALCRWVLCAAAEACLPDGHPQLQWPAEPEAPFPAAAPVPEGCVPREPGRAYWIALGDHAVGRLLAVLGTGADIQGAAAKLCGATLAASASG